MFRSMTAYGCFQFFIEESAFLIEIASVNRKNLDVNIHLPKELLYFDLSFRKKLSKELRRGFVTVRLSKEKGRSNIKALAGLNPDELKKKLEILKKIASHLGFDPKKEISFPFLLNCNLSFDESLDMTFDEKGEKALMEGFEKALTQFILMREKEGALLMADFYPYLDMVEKGLSKVDKQRAAAGLKFQNRLKSKLKEIGLLSDSEDERLLKEVVFFADKVDFQEEITRVFAHTQQFRELLSSDQLKSGKEMDFLIQEINRELNTIGAKAQDLQITKEVLAMKSGVEKIREQIQNIE